MDRSFQNGISNPPFFHYFLIQSSKFTSSYFLFDWPDLKMFVVFWECLRNTGEWLGINAGVVEGVIQEWLGELGILWGSGWGLIQEWLGCNLGVIGEVLWEFVIIKIKTLKQTLVTSSFSFFNPEHNNVHCAIPTYLLYFFFVVIIKTQIWGSEKFLGNTNLSAV